MRTSDVGLCALMVVAQFAGLLIGLALIIRGTV